jgi:hypothetical protein
MSEGPGCAKWLVATVIALLAAGAGIVAILNYVSAPRVEMSQYEVGIDRYAGQDYSNFTVPGVQACSSACLNDPKCMSFSFHVKTNHCWLKSDVPLRVENNEFTSGVKIPKPSWKLW